MAQKRKHSASSLSSHAFDRRRFKSSKTFQHYTQSTIHRNIMPERGIELQATVVDDMKSRGWIKFLETPESACIPVVREFYANALERDGFQVFVRGNYVSFDRSTINKFFGLPDIEDDWYTTYKSQVDYEKVLKFLTVKKTSWKWNKKRPVNFCSQALEIASKRWHYFVGARLLPSTHFSTVSTDRAVLIYAIENDLSIDVGRVIEKSILEHISPVRTVGLPHPSLITGLCKQAGVQWDASDEYSLPQKIIDIKGFSNAEFDNRPPRRRVHHYHSARTGSVDERLSSVEDLFQDLRAELLHLSDMSHALAEQQKSFFAYQASMNVALAQAFSQLGASVEFPLPPTMNQLPTRPNPDEPHDDLVGDVVQG